MAGAFTNFAGVIPKGDKDFGFTLFINALLKNNRNMETETITQNAESMRPTVGIKRKSKQNMWMVWHLFFVPLGVVCLIASFSLINVLIPALPQFLFFIVATVVTCVILLWSGGMVFRTYRQQTDVETAISAAPSIAKRLISYYGIILLTVSVIFFSGCFLTTQFPDKDKLSERTKYMEKIFIHELTK